MANMLEPFRDFVSLREAMNNLLEDSWVRPLAVGSGAQARTFPVDIYQTEGELVVRASLPGVKPDDLQLTVLNGVLTLKAEHKTGSHNGQGQYLRQEITYGSFERSFELPLRVQPEQAKAEFEHGVLTVRLPKAEDAKPKQIKINVSGANAIEGEKVSK
jgi:HSP20 family protein